MIDTTKEVPPYHKATIMYNIDTKLNCIKYIPNILIDVFSISCVFLFYKDYQEWLHLMKSCGRFDETLSICRYQSNITELS